ncbi:MAG: RNA polymerase sigma factor [Verrucomicrobia bacterium]|nr:RNA polymerase sigma factor [Verrucomicrobiota bacterium]
MQEADPISSEWLQRVRAHDEAASRALVERLFPLVQKIVRAHRPQRMAEEDLCQEVFMSLFASLEQYRGAVPFEHWVSRVAVNTCIDHLRRHRSRPELRWADLTAPEAGALEALLAREPAPSPGQALAVTDLVGRLLETLAPEDRLVVQLLELEARSVKEVRALTGWSTPLVKVRAFRARHKLRRALARLLAQEKS